MRQTIRLLSRLQSRLSRPSGRGTSKLRLVRMKVFVALESLADAPGRPERSPAQAPLRTVRESFPSHGSSLSKISLCRGDPAIRFVCTSILSCHRILPGCERTGFSHRISAPGEASPLLKILDRLRLVRIGFSSNLDVA